MDEKSLSVFINYVKQHNRILILCLTVIIMFLSLIVRLYNLQIIYGEQYATNIDNNITRVIPLQALRGNIYDRFGRPLAINKTAFCVKFDPGARIENPNEVIINLLNVFEKNDVNFIDELPISVEEPYEFKLSSEIQEKRWKLDMGMENEKLEYSATETIEHLRKFFNIPENLSNQEARSIISIRSAIYMQRYRQYNTIILAKDVNHHVVAALEEHGEDFPGFFVDIDALRFYPEEEYFSHILGYIRPISDDEYEIYKDMGYSNSDLIGKLGIEKAYELQLAGEKGEEIAEITSNGKVVRTEIISPPKTGDNIYLTLDVSLQKKATSILIDHLKEVLLKKLDSGEITLKQLFVSMVKSNNISVKQIMNAADTSMNAYIKALILKEIPDFYIKKEEDIQKIKDIQKAKDVICSAIEQNQISISQFVLCLYEQEKIACDEETLIKLKNGTASPYSIIRSKISNGEITPQQTNLDPCTGSVAVVDVSSGDVLALVTYPSYDNNMLVNNFNNEYFQTLRNDPTFPMINRPLMERKAPGSTLKMLSAIAGLESGTITTQTKILDKGEYTDAGRPYAKCLIYSRYGVTHGPVDVRKAIEVSCNYFFYEMAYRMGNAKEGTTLNSIGTFNEYMKKFGLSEQSGAEIEESKPVMANPEAQMNIMGEKWTDGDAIRSAIGQSVNSYTVSQMAKYIATLANGGSRYKLNLVDGVRSSDDKSVRYVPPTLEDVIKISPENLSAVHGGMLDVTSGDHGTLRNIFADFPIQVAGKTGTAEESNKRPSHTWFTGFAPFDKPQIAVVVMIPFGETASSPAPKIAKEIIAEYFGLNTESEGPVQYNTLTR